MYIVFLLLLAFIGFGIVGALVKIQEAIDNLTDSIKEIKNESIDSN